MDDCETQLACTRRVIISRGVFCLLIWLLCAANAGAMTPEEEHASHHPGQAGGASAAPSPATLSGANSPMGVGPPSAVGPPSVAGPGMAGMGEMMKSMGLPKPKDFYPSLMDLPNLSPEQRQFAQSQAHERMKHGSTLMNEGAASLSNAAATDNFGEMQQATEKLREGLAMFETGLAANRALAEGKAPRNVALDWFKREMNLTPVANVSDSARGIFGITWFHAFVMLLLSVFTVVMIGMYFRKMQRATLLLQRLTGGGLPAAALSSAASPSTSAKATQTAASAAMAPPVKVNGPAPNVSGSGSLAKWSGKLRIGQIFEETHNVKTFRLMDPLGGEIPFVFLPGQYLTVTVLPEGKPVRRSYTIASSPSEHAYVDLTIKREDKGIESRYLQDRVQTGDLLDFTGPSGSFVFTGRECKCLVFIAAGVGITPLMSVTRYLTDRSWPGEIFLLFSCHSPRDFIFREELEFLQSRHPNLHVIATVTSAEGADWKGPTGRISKELIAQSVPGIASRRVHICGPKEMMEATEKFLAELGVPKEQIKTEAFGPAIGKPEPAVATAPSATPKAPATIPEPEKAAIVTVEFSKAQKTAPLSPEKSVLEASEDIGVNIPFECRVGTCGVCKTKLISGEVTMAIEDALTPEDKAAGIILACQAKSTGNVVVEA